MFIVFEGIDGSGKSTQLKLLNEAFGQKGAKTALIDFPRYGEKSAGLVEEYLVGKYGSPEEVGPYRASIFYACDRYAANFKIKKWLKEGKIVISDRYIGSNVGHQGGKIKNKKEREKFLKWLYNLEYKIFGIPKPDITFLLKTSPSFSQKLSANITDKAKKKKKKIYLGFKKQDSHEKDKKHLQNAAKAYLETAKMNPKEIKIIECVKKGKMLAPEIIHQKIWNTVKKELKFS